MKKPVNGEPRSTAGSQTVDRALALVQLVAAQSGHGTCLSELAANASNQIDLGAVARNV